MTPVGATALSCILASTGDQFEETVLCRALRSISAAGVDARLYYPTWHGASASRQARQTATLSVAPRYLPARISP